MDEIVELSRALSTIAKTVERQKRRERQPTTTDANTTHVNVYSDLSLRLAKDLSDVVFRRKVVRVHSHTKETSDSTLGRQKKRFLAKIEPKIEEKEKKSKKCEKKVAKNETTRDTQKWYSKREIRDFIAKQKALRGEAREEQHKIPKVRNYDVIAVRQYMHEKRRQRAPPKQRTNIETVVAEIPEVLKEAQEETADDDHKTDITESETTEQKTTTDDATDDKRETSDFGASTESKADDTEDLSLCVRAAVERAMRQLPDWETLCERVFNDSSQRLRALEASSHSLFRLTSDLADDNDDTDDVSSLRSEVVSECVASLDLRQEVHEICRRIHALGPNEHKIRDLHFDGQTGSPFRVFLFDFCKELVLKEFRMNCEPEVTLTVPLRLQKRFWPTESHCLTEFVVQSCEQLIGRNESQNKDIRRQKLMAFCRQNRKRDFIDGVLLREMADEDPLWTHFEAESRVVRERIANSILRDLVSESLPKSFNKINKIS